MKKIDVESKYLLKVDKIEKARTEKSRMDQEQLDRLQHSMDKRFGRTMQNKEHMSTLTKKKARDLTSKFRSSIENLALKNEENAFKSQQQRENTEEAKRATILKNLEKA